MTLKTRATIKGRRRHDDNLMHAAFNMPSDQLSRGREIENTFVGVKRILVFTSPATVCSGIRILLLMVGSYQDKFTCE
jgi:hypothetical protein